MRDALDCSATIKTVAGENDQTATSIPELVALFIPLSAWLIASRRDNWHHLMAATFVTVAIAVPMLLLACWIELYVSPRILLMIL